MAKKKTAAKRSTSRRALRRKNDLLRELLQFVVKAIESADQKTQSLEGIEKLRKALPDAVQDLKANPGGVQKKGG